MFDLEISKNKGQIEVGLKGNCSIAPLDIALKNICVQLKMESKKEKNFIANRGRRINRHLKESPYLNFY